MTKLELFLIAVILLCLGGIAYFSIRGINTPPPANPLQHKYDSLQSVLLTRDDSINVLNIKLKESRLKDTVIITKYTKVRERIAGADERTLDSLIMEYVNDSL